jgi:hypothetical protein
VARWALDPLFPLSIYYWQIKWLKMGCVIWQAEAQTGFALGFVSIFSSTTTTTT